MDYSVLRALIDQFEAFEKETARTDLKTFSVWLYNSMHKEETEDFAFEKMQEPGNLDVEIARGIGLLNIHARHYVKTALRDTPLVSINDFLFLGTLMEEGDQRKTELIQRNMSEFSPGMEVIRRLLRRGLMEDYDDPEDKRSKRVRMTEAGRKEFLRASRQIAIAAQIVSGNLSEKEKRYLVPLLNKLLAFHEPIWEEDNGVELEVIADKYKP